jgi:ATP-binding cassette subfamily B protein
MPHGAWQGYLHYDESKSKPQVDRVLRRVFLLPALLGLVTLELVCIVAVSLLGLVPPLLYRDLIDTAIPEQDLMRLNLLALGMIAIPLVSGLIGVAQRYGGTGRRRHHL